MIGKMYDHVLFKDLVNYLKRTDYLGGYTQVELNFIRKNIGAITASDVLDLIDKAESGIKKCTYSTISDLINSNSLIAGVTYAITDFLTIYQSSKQENDKYITYGLTINPSLQYTIITQALSESTLSRQVIILSSDVKSLLWDVLYDPTLETLDDGITTKGKIIYLKDENGNVASYDFKNIIGSDGYTFQKDKIENSENCYNNNILYASNIYFLDNSSDNFIKGSNIKFKQSVNNLKGTLNNVIIDEDFSDTNEKHVLNTTDKTYIEYFDNETLTNQLYGIE